MKARFEDPASSEATRTENGALREWILKDPDAVLEDPEIMAALLRSSEGQDRKVLDLRAAQLQRLETRLSKLRQAHRDVVEAALESMSGVEQAHQAALALIDGETQESLASKVRSRLPLLMNLDEARLCLCLDDPGLGAARSAVVARGALSAPAAPRRRWIDRMRHRLLQLLADPEETADRSALDSDPLDPALVLLPADAILECCPKPLRRGHEKRSSDPGPGRPVAISVREARRSDRMMFGVAVDRLEAVAAMTLDLGPKRSMGALVFGSADEEILRSSQLIEQLAFLGGVVERLIRSEDALDALLATRKPTPHALRLERGAAPEARR